MFSRLSWCSFPGWFGTACRTLRTCLPWLALVFTVSTPAADGETNRLSRGYKYLNDQDPSVPWSIHILRVQRGHPNLEFHTTLGRRTSFGMANVSEQVKILPPSLGIPVGAINGDFYRDEDHYEGRPRDLQICRGELISNPAGHACFWIDTAGQPQMTNVVSRFRIVLPDGTDFPFVLNGERPRDGIALYTASVGASTRTRGGTEFVLERPTNSSAAWFPLSVGQTYAAQVRKVSTAGDSPVSTNYPVLSVGPKFGTRLNNLKPGAVLQIITETTPDLTGVKMAVGGGPTLIRNGTISQWSGIQLRHPRSAIGWNKDSIFLVEVDGRQNNLSVGMSFPELANYLATKLGCDNAMNLDGGGSATLWVLGNVMNSPSEGQERPAANALVVVERRTRHD